MPTFEGWHCDDDGSPRSGKSVFYRAASDAEPNPNAIETPTVVTDVSGHWELTTPAGEWDVYLLDGPTVRIWKARTRLPLFTGDTVIRTSATPSASLLVIVSLDTVPQGSILVVPVSGTTQIFNIQPPANGTPILVLEFTDALLMAPGGNLYLERDLATQTGTVLTLEWDGTAFWREMSRSRELLLANAFIAGPSSGGSGSPVNRYLVAADLPWKMGLATTSGIDAGGPVGGVEYYYTGATIVFPTAFPVATTAVFLTAVQNGLWAAVAPGTVSPIGFSGYLNGLQPTTSGKQFYWLALGH